MNHYQTIKQAIELITAGKPDHKSFANVATLLKKSPGHLRKIFSQWAGISPKQFDRYLRLQKAKQFLAQDKNHLQTTFLSGLSSGGRLHDLFVDIEAMTPGQYQNGGKNLIIFYSIFESRFGKILIASTDRGICNILFCDTIVAGITDLKRRWPKAHLLQKTQSMHLVIQKYFKDLKPNSKIKFHVRGTNFQIKVWEALLSIPPGAGSTYGKIAAHIGKPNAVRAVGNAVGDNPVCYIIPCHRVLRSNGEIGGYYWGVERKRTMLAYEEIKRKLETRN
jgi:AraC family transcriptional regulator of adaptative response/methylated-DNA-[protein]-cysteine methyltransferase